jgi:hypothetical protein
MVLRARIARSSHLVGAPASTPARERSSELAGVDAGAPRGAWAGVERFDIVFERF